MTNAEDLPGGKYSFIANPIEAWLGVDYFPLFIFSTMGSIGIGLLLGFLLSG